VTIETGPGVGDAPNCTDSLRNGTETDVDCGGASCPSCADGSVCTAGSDCLSGVCTRGMCMAASCTDRLKNGTETDTDCGGASCSPCADGDACTARGDCLSGVCTDGICMAPSCTDRAKNGTETAIDCGGASCPPCADGRGCAVAADCQSGVCTGGVCAVSSCGDGVVQAPEACDDGNSSNDDSCRNDCTRPAVAALAVGAYHTCTLLDNGSIKCWGDNYTGPLGLGDTEWHGNQPGEMGDNLPTVNLGTGRTAVALSAGGYHTCALLNDGGVKCWGLNDYGQLGLGDTSWRGNGPGQMGDNLPTVSLGTGRTALALAACVYHTCAILDNGSVKCWGDNYSGQLGLGDTEWRGDEPGEMGDNLPAVSLGTGRTAIAISTGSYHTCALLDNGSVKCWGQNESAALGLGDTEWRGGAPGEMGDNLPAVDFGTGRTAVSIAAGERHTCAILDNGSVKCWGSNRNGELGQGDMIWRGGAPGQMGDSLAAVNLGTGRTAASISAGYLRSCAILDNGSVKCWGYNGYGALGLGDTLDRGDNANEMGEYLSAVDLGVGKAAIAIGAGRAHHVCALLNASNIKCWGHNTAGQLGLGDPAHRGDQTGEMGDNLPTVQLWGP
jgi:alpha-tubulin suppressor-like RCC1 family protein